MSSPITVGVVDVLVFRPAVRGWLVLALRRSAATRCPGSWEMVHGKVEPGEALEQSAVRELREETGLRPDRLFSITMHPFYLVPSATPTLAAVFAAIVPTDASVQLGAEHDKLAWLTVSQARRRFSWPHERTALDHARELIQNPIVHDVLEVPKERW